VRRPSLGGGGVGGDSMSVVVRLPAAASMAHPARRTLWMVPREVATGYRDHCLQGITGTVEMLFMGEPSISLVL